MKAGNITIRRLRTCVRALRNIKEPTALQPDGEPLFTMSHVAHACGTPACALGHYLAAVGRLETRKQGFQTLLVYRGEERSQPQYDEIAQQEFPALDMQEIHELFAAYGCGHARWSVTRAADYIDAFIARKLAEG